MMKFFLLLGLSFVFNFGAQAASCNGKPEPRICEGACYVNHDCKKGKWVVSGREICEPCKSDNDNRGKSDNDDRNNSDNDDRSVSDNDDGLCGGKPMPRICDGNCLQNYDCVKGKWQISGREICMSCH